MMHWLNAKELTIRMGRMDFLVQFVQFIIIAYYNDYNTIWK